MRVPGLILLNYLCTGPLSFAARKKSQNRNWGFPATDRGESRRRWGTRSRVARFTRANPTKRDDVRVLVVEDEWLVALEMRLILEDLGHEVVGIAPDSRRAREIAAKGVDVEIESGLSLTSVRLVETCGSRHGNAEFMILIK